MKKTLGNHKLAMLDFPSIQFGQCGKKCTLRKTALIIKKEDRVFFYHFLINSDDLQDLLQDPILVIAGWVYPWFGIPS